MIEPTHKLINGVVVELNEEEKKEVVAKWAASEDRDAELKAQAEQEAELKRLQEEEAYKAALRAEILKMKLEGLI